MAVVAVGHAADERELVGLLGQLGKQAAELESRHIGGDHGREVAHVVAAGVRLGVPGVDVRHAAPQEDLDHRFGLDPGTPAAGRRLAGSAAQIAGQVDRPPAARSALKAPADHLASRDALALGCPWSRYP